MEDFGWSEQSIEAAQLIAQGRLTYVGIAKKVGVAKGTLFNWKKHPQFAQRIKDAIKELDEWHSDLAITRKSQRIAWLNKLAVQLQSVIKKSKPLTAEDMVLVREYRATIKQAAEEMGQLGVPVVDTPLEQPKRILIPRLLDGPTQVDPS